MNNDKKIYRLILILTSIKLLIHLFANTNYGFHRDEYLYLEEGQNLAWGYMEIPPLVAFLGKISHWLGGSVFITRLFPSLIGSLTVFLIGRLIQHLGGKFWAVLVGCLAFIISPAYLGSNYLFQPVSFNQFFWFLSAFLMIRLVQTEDVKYWYYLGITAGLGFMTKYAILFFFAALILSVIISPHRKWFATKHPYIAMGIAIAIALPNIIWQAQHNFPVLNHMKELRELQLVNVDKVSFVIAQFKMQMGAAFIWLAGLIGLFAIKKWQPYRFIGFTFILVILILISLSGKSYYTLGAFAMLFVFGGLVFEEFIKPVFIVCLLAIFTIITAPVVPFGLPVLSIETVADYCDHAKNELGLVDIVRWEDGKIHEIRQDHADMHGWEEMVKKVSKVYHSLPPEKQKTCMIYGGSYGHAGAINYFRKKYQLPKAQSLSSSFMIWANKDFQFDNQIMIDDRKQNSSNWFNQLTLMDSVSNPYARDPGYIYYRTDPKPGINQKWKEIVESEKAPFNFK